MLRPRQISEVVFRRCRQRGANGHDLRRECCGPRWLRRRGGIRQSHRNGEFKGFGLIGDNRIGVCDHVDGDLNIRFSLARPSCPFLFFRGESDQGSKLLAAFLTILQSVVRRVLAASEATRLRKEIRLRNTKRLRYDCRR